MKQLVIVPLSRQEEDTLRLIDEHGGNVTLSDFGRLRLAQSQDLKFLSLIRAARLRPLLRVRLVA